MDFSLQTIGLTVLLVSLWSFTSDAAALNDYILDYQPLQFNPLHLHERHSRVKRALDPYLRFSFKAYGRTFNLQLEPAKTIFADNHELVFGSEVPQQVDTSFIYDGIIAGDPSSSVHLSLINSSVSGQVTVPGHTTYHIEPAVNHFTNPTFHTIIYPESQMNLDPYRHKREGSGTCGSKQIYQNLQHWWTPLDSTQRRSKRESTWENNYHNKYSAAVNMELERRAKRDLRPGFNTCFMSLRADGLLYQRMLNKHGQSATKAREEILSLFASHIKALNNIYSNTVFQKKDGSSIFTGVQFLLQRTEIMSNCSAVNNGYCTDNLDVSNFLDLTASEDRNDFCLVHTFTYRDFVGGTLGLAWVATPNSPSSGVCGKYGRVRDSNNGIAFRSLNTGIVTLINFNQPVPSRVSQLTFAHEVGHNFGAPHDTTSECAPFGTNEPGASDGNYIMFPSATQGNLPNNDDFSVCSRDSIARVLATLEPNGRRNYCFKSSNTAFCGNNVVEGSEECDCGYADQCFDQCCVGRKMDGSGCTHKLSSVCSPSEGQCCRDDCTFESSTVECSEETDCTESANCSGTNATCEEPKQKNDKTFCSSATKVCLSGECIGSVCLRIGWIECFLTSSKVSNDEQMCYISCKANDSAKCVSSFDQTKVDRNPDFKKLLEEIRQQNPTSDSSLGVQRPPGSPCNDYKGYCDVFSRCRNVDAEGPFKQLTDLIFDPVTLKKIENWIETKWWAVLLMGIGVVVLMGVFVKIFEYNTPSKNPRRAAQAQGRSQGVSRANNDKRSSAYTTDVPMYDRMGYGRNQNSKGGANRGHDNYGYNGQSAQPQIGGHQQFDRISGPRRY